MKKQLPKLIIISLLILDVFFIVFLLTKQPSVSSALHEISLHFKKPDELRVSQSITAFHQLAQKQQGPMIFLKLINKPAVVQKLYYTILDLPKDPLAPNAPHFCGRDPTLTRYDLSFYQSHTLIQHAVINIIACGGSLTVTVDGSYRREFYDEYIYLGFEQLLQDTFGMTKAQLTNGR